MSTYKLIRQKGGYGHYAVFSLKAVAESDVPLVWPDDIRGGAYFKEPARQGVDLAVRYHVESGGQPACFEVTEFLYTNCDTSPTDVTCAAACAAWLELGRLISGLTLTWDGPNKTWLIERA